MRDAAVTPRADEFEAALLGSVLLDSSLLDTLDVSAESFFDARHRIVWETVRKMREDGIPVDVLSLAEAIERNGQLDQIGGADDCVTFLRKLLEVVPNSAHAHYYAKGVNAAFTKRRFVESLDSVRQQVSVNANLDDLPDEYLPLLQSCGYRSDRLQPVSAAKLLADYPAMRPAVIDGLLRLGETANFIAATKVGKSWLAHDLVVSVATGQRWFGTFDVVPGQVLLIDNELHRETLANRLSSVAEAHGIRLADIGDTFQVISLRGKLRDLFTLEKDLIRSVQPGRFKLIVLDAFYRFLPDGTDENDNGAMGRLYNCIDRIAERLGCAIVLIHHASKGNQSGKGITDIGSGAGAQSRAVDAHVVLRPHETEGAAVLEAVVRSWKPVAPLGLRWEFPVFQADPSLDTTQLRRDGRRQIKAISATPSSTALDSKGFAAKFLT